MRDVLDVLLTATTRSPVALARIVHVTGSSPRLIGSALVVTPDGVVCGSLSSGCVEASVVATAADVIATGVTSVDRFGWNPADSQSVGLTCGGEIEVMVERVDGPGVFAELHAAVAAGEPCALVSTLTGRTQHTLLRGQPHDDDAIGGPWDRVTDDARALLASGASGVVGDDDAAGCRRSVFVQSFATAPRIIIAGANDFVRALADVAGILGFHVTVVDARATFASSQRFPSADEVVIDWPDRYLRAEHAAGLLDRRTVVCVMTHDDKFDVPMLRDALSLERFAFVGALGSRRTHDDRVERLIDAGVSPADLARLASPIGLDLDARTPEETAVSIAAHIIASRTQASGRPLARLDGPIHRAR